MVDRKGSWLLRILIFGIFFFLSSFKIWEQDIFWQMRAGRELLETLSFPQGDTWSFTGSGNPWMNFQWLSTLLFDQVFLQSSYWGLVALRSIVSAGLFLAILSLIKNGSRKASVAVIPFLLLAYLATLERIQLRSDFLAMFIFAWISVLMQNEEVFKKQVVIILLSAILITNVHPGGVPFLALSSLYWIRRNNSYFRTFLVFFLIGIVFCLNPYGFYVYDYIFHHLRYSTVTLLQNPDHLGITLGYLLRSSNQIPILSWLVISLLAFVYFFRKRYESASLVGAAVLLIFVVMSLNRVRAIPYQVIFCAPFAFDSAIYLYERSTLKGMWRILALAAVPLFLFIQLNLFGPPFGFAVDKTVIPVEAAERMSKAKGVDRIYTQPSYGQYLAWRFPDAKVSMDTREMMYTGFQETALKLHHDPTFMQKWLAENRVDAILVPILNVAAEPGKGFRDLIEEYYPSTSWALVYFDSFSILLISRAVADQQGGFFYKSMSPTRYNVLPLSLYDQLEVDECMKPERPHVVCRLAYKLPRKLCLEEDEVGYLISLSTTAEYLGDKELVQWSASVLNRDCQRGIIF